ncbi:MAG: hypothetical protein ACW986_09195 [Promethearchaeota archaeon]|jgi:hypothetical protein
MTKKYKNQQLMKFLTIIGAIVGLIYLILGLTAIGNQYQVLPIDVGLHIVVNFIIGLLVVILTFWVGLKPNAPLPFHWLVLLILAILLVIFVDIIAGILVLIAFLIGLIEDL